MSHHAAKSDPTDEIVDSALTLIAERGWRGVDTGTVLEASGASPAAFHTRFDDLYGVLEAAARRVMTEMQAVEADFEDEEDYRDRLFALIMAAFDAATPWRKTIEALLRAAPFDPLLSATAARSLQRMATLALETAAGQTPRGRGFSLRAAVLAPTVLAPAGRVWLRDDSADLSRTMAALDKALGRAERLARFAGPLAGGRPRVGGKRSPADDAPAIPAPDPKPETAGTGAPAKPASPRKSGARAKNGG